MHLLVGWAEGLSVTVIPPSSPLDGGKDVLQAHNNYVHFTYITTRCPQFDKSRNICYRFMVCCT